MTKVFQNHSAFISFHMIIPSEFYQNNSDDMYQSNEIIGLSSNIGIVAMFRK